MNTTTTLTNANLAELATVLNERRTHAVDVVVAAKTLVSDMALIGITGVAPILSDEGVTNVDGWYQPTTVADEGIANKLGIPVAYLRRMRAEYGGLYDANVNGWLSRSEDRYMLRLLQSTEPGEIGTLRAVLSDSYKTIDDFDVLLAVLRGIEAAGATDAQITADLTERRMYVRVTSPTIAARATEMVKDYRSPFDTSRNGRDYPLVFAGFVVTNSEVGQGAFNIVPRITWQVCTNGQTMSEDAMRRVHLGAKMDEGVVRWSAATLRKNLELVTSQTTDAVATFMSADYVQAKVDAMARQAGVEITEPNKVINDVSSRLGFTKTQAAEILSQFIKGGSMTAGGVMQAVTAAAQTISDRDLAYDMESNASAALALAASAR